MGFKRKNRIYRLDFSETELDGLEVRVGGLTTGEFLDFIGLSATDEDSNGTQRLLQMFADHLRSWNLEDDDSGEPVPATLEGVKSMDFKTVMTIVNAWTDALASVSESTGKKSTSGETSPAVSIPMETLS